MLKNISTIKDSKVLTKTEQININGGLRSLCPSRGSSCPNDAAMIPVNCITHEALCCRNNSWVKC